MESVRPAVAADLERVVALVDEFVDEQRPQRGGEVWAALETAALRNAEAISAAIDDDDSLVLLGCVHDIDVGLLLASIEPLADGSTLAVISCLYVEPDGRQVGVGTAMLDETIGWAEQRGCRGVDATVLPGNRSGKNFFEMHGMVARAIKVHRVVGEG
jgi:GNAT superfamily N-acetyltransferase